MKINHFPISRDFIDNKDASIRRYMKFDNQFHSDAKNLATCGVCFLQVAHWKVRVLLEFDDPLRNPRTGENSYGGIVMPGRFYVINLVRNNRQREGGVI
jgi:hypothetical protein